ncbi:MAG: SLC13 family permease [Anaerolineae bacterium]|nr:SLC13 family permease [Anaerolineae bacterium]
MTGEIALLLAVLAGTLILLSFEWIPADVIGFIVVLVLIFTGLLDPAQAFAGFGSETAIMLLGLLIMTAALVRTGVVDFMGRWILRYTEATPDRLLLVIMLSAAGLSALMSNTATAAFFLPIVLGISRRLKVSASRLLMPLAFATILASSLTLVSTSTNIVINGVMIQYRLEPMGMFELTPVGIPVVIVGLLYMYFVGRRLVPDRTASEADHDYGEYSYLTEAVVLPDSALVGQTLEESGLRRDLDLNILRIVRDKKRYINPEPNLRLKEGDLLLVEGMRDGILKIRDTGGIELKSDYKLEELEPEEELKLAEILILPRSSFIQRSLKTLRFRERYNIHVLAINRHGETIRRKISSIALRVGDVLLVQGIPRDIAQLARDDTLRVIGTVTHTRLNSRRAPIAVAIFVGALVVASLNILSVPVAVLAGAVLTFLTRCITPQEAYQEIEWTVIILIGSMLALGVAMETTGTAEYLANLLVDVGGHLGGFALLTGFFVLAVILTQPMSNQAAAVVLVPVAIQTALQLGLNPRTFAMMIAVAASCSYLTPLEPACLMVYGPGQYKFSDFLRVGSLLTALIYGIAIVLVPIIWPL